ncbi:MAG: crotonase/enoyl-CoA hydratase family protein [Polyangiaceae bacterium]|nr:crotonase/enoyl-CoA hydratase family protein [Polyangiaceae bacterium]
MGERVRLNVSGGVATVTLSRADKRNALDLSAFEQIVAAGEQLGADNRVRAVVLHGEGPDFCAGLDVMGVMADPGAVQKLLTRNPDVSSANLAQRVARIWRELKVPVVAALHGSVLGGGLQIALGADMRVVHPAAKLCVMEIHWGLIPDMSASLTLPELVGRDRALELTLSGRVLSGIEAFELGLATKLADEPLEAAASLAADIAARSPDAVRGIKEIFSAREASDASRLLIEERIQRRILGSKNQWEAVSANLEKRPGVFEEPMPEPPDSSG